MTGSYDKHKFVRKKLKNKCHNKLSKRGLHLVSLETSTNGITKVHRQI